MDEIEAAARALWQIGNERIGHREWDGVKDHYIREASAALTAAGFDRLKAENASLLESLREAERERDEARADAAESVRHYSECHANHAAAEQRNTALEGALRKIERKTHIPPKPGMKLSGWYSVIADVNDHARAALHDEERSAPPQEGEG